jgi:hypothetical protein
MIMGDERKFVSLSIKSEWEWTAKDITQKALEILSKEGRLDRQSFEVRLLEEKIINPDKLTNRLSETGRIEQTGPNGNNITGEPPKETPKDQITLRIPEEEKKLQPQQ